MEQSGRNPSQLVATAGPYAGSNKAKPVPCVANGCRGDAMVGGVDGSSPSEGFPPNVPEWRIRPSYGAATAEVAPTIRHS